MSYYKSLKKQELIDLIESKDNEIDELLYQIEWLGNVEADADKRIKEARLEGVELLEDVIFKLRWLRDINEDPKEALDKAIRTISDSIHKASGV